MLSVVLTYTLLFAPTIAGLNAMLVNARRTLLLFPDEVIGFVPTIKAVMREYAKQNMRGYYK